MPTLLLLIAVPLEVLTAVDDTDIESDPFALPARTCVFAWQVDLNDETPGGIDLIFEIAMNLEGPYTPYDTVDETDFTDGVFFRTITTPTAARFGRITGTNATALEVTATVIGKVAVP